MPRVGDGEATSTRASAPLTSEANRAESTPAPNFLISPGVAAARRGIMEYVAGRGVRPDGVQFVFTGGRLK